MTANCCAAGLVEYPHPCPWHDDKTEAGDPEIWTAEERAAVKRDTDAMFEDLGRGFNQLAQLAKNQDALIGWQNKIIRQMRNLLILQGIAGFILIIISANQGLEATAKSVLGGALIVVAILGIQHIYQRIREQIRRRWPISTSSRKQQSATADEIPEEESIA
jgi:hypothetical protein